MTIYDIALWLVIGWALGWISLLGVVTFKGVCTRPEHGHKKGGSL